MTIYGVVLIDFLLVAGVVGFLFSCFLAYRVVEYYSNPNYEPFRWPLGLLGFVALVFLVEGFALVPLWQLFPVIGEFQYFSHIAQAFAVSIFASIVGSGWLVLRNLREYQKAESEGIEVSYFLSWPALILFVSPWAILTINFVLRLGLISS